MTITQVDDTPRIYVACLASYNAGILHGAWIDADRDAEEIMEEIRVILRSSPEPNVLVDCPECEGAGCEECKDGKVPSSEEWAIHDYEGFGGVQIAEYQGIEEVADLAAKIAEYGEAYACYVDHEGIDHATVEGFEEAYCGEWDSEQDYAEYLFDECYEVPDYLQFYIDYEKFARDIFIGDNYSLQGPSGQLHIFRHC